jgi:hypothetical protein
LRPARAPTLTMLPPVASITGTVARGMFGTVVTF